jgi:hypothetical protein
VLIGPGDAAAAAEALERVAGDAELRARLVEGGLARARAQTLEAETGRVARFLSGGRAGA